MKGFGEKYPEAVRKFALRIQFHSSSAYRELRKLFTNNLPTIRTMQRWLTSIDASPGITDVAINAISRKANVYKSRGEQLHLCLITDDMSIRQKVSFNKNKMEFEGFSTSSSSRNNNKVPMLKEASVFMAVGPDFRIAVAYQLLNGQNAIDRASFTKEVIRRLDLTGAKTISLTGDGLNLNMAVAKLLGANFDNNKPYFERPSNPDENIYIIFDPPHMFKLMRKYLCLQKLQNGHHEMKWSLLENLAAKQDKDNFSLSNKLTRNHISWMENKMNVERAVQIFSNENADALEQLCDDHYEDFIGCEKFVEFLRLCNNIFDVMNFAEVDEIDDNFKMPMCPSTIEKITGIFESFKQFVDEMTIEIKHKKKISRVPAKKQMGFLGLLINCQSMIGIYKEYFESTGSPVFYLFQCCQDSLETFFSLIRQCLGANSNPSVEQFTAAYRKLLFCTPHISKTVKTNCNIEFPNELLNVSSQTTSTTGTRKLFTTQAIMHAAPFEVEMDIFSFIGHQIEEYESYDQHMYALAAYAVEKDIIQRIQRQTVSGCKQCSHVFAENAKISDSLITKKILRKTKIEQPASSTLKIIFVCEKINNELQSIENVSYQSMARTILSNINLVEEELYGFTEFESHQSGIESSQITHKQAFLLDVICTYLNIKARRICKLIAMEEQAESQKKRSERRLRILAGK